MQIPVNWSRFINPRHVSYIFYHWLQADLLHCWLCLVAALPVYHLIVLLSVRSPLPLIIFSIVLWSVAWLPLEDSLPGLRVASARRPGFVAGFILLVLLVIRGGLIQRANDPFVVFLPAGLGLSLALLCRPVRELRVFKEELSTLALLPMITLLPPLLPERWLSESGALFASVFLQIFGVNASQAGVTVSVGASSVNVAGPCSGSEMIAQAVVVAFLALIAFPMPYKITRIPVLILAPVLAWLSNGMRIALLAFIAYLDPASAVEDTGIFSFFHLGEGGMVFSSLGIGVFAYIYVFILETQLRARQS